MSECRGFPLGLKCHNEAMRGMSNHWCAPCNVKRSEQLLRQIPFKEKD